MYQTVQLKTKSPSSRSSITRSRVGVRTLVSLISIFALACVASAGNKKGKGAQHDSESRAAGPESRHIQATPSPKPKQHAAGKATKAGKPTVTGDSVGTGKRIRAGKSKSAITSHPVGAGKQTRTGKGKAKSTEPVETPFNNREGDSRTIRA